MRPLLTFVPVLFFLGIVACQGQTDSLYSYRPGSADGIGKWYMGREIAHVMGASGSAWLEREERPDEENTNLAIANIQIPAGGAIADVGAGTGYYTFRLSKKFPGATVYAVDIQDEMIGALQKKKSTLRAGNVQVIKGAEKTPNLPANSIDLAIMVDVYHELEYPHEILQALRKSLKPHGRILLIEYRGEDASVPIKPLHKTTVNQTNRELTANGFRLKEDQEFLPIQHFLVYEKQ